MGQTRSNDIIDSKKQFVRMSVVWTENQYPTLDLRFYQRNWKQFDLRTRWQRLMEWFS